MCRICIDWQMGNITTKEAAKNFWEMADTLDRDHAEKLADEITMALIEEELEGEE